jgi:ubiquinone/menaquinone biosynthesis C-methylase UbiE
MGWKEIRSELLAYAAHDSVGFHYFIVSNLNWMRYEKQVLQASGLIASGAHVLELGCGCGHTAAMLADLRKDLKVCATDLQEVETWNVLRASGCSFSCGDAMAIPFKDELFDVIVSFGVIEHVPSAQRFLDESRRCLKKGGKLIIFNLPNRFSFPEFIARRFPTVCHQTMYTRRQALSLVENNGFKVASFQREHLVPAQVDRISAAAGMIFNKIYIVLWGLDRVLCCTFLAFFCQDFGLVAEKR